MSYRARTLFVAFISCSACATAPPQDVATEDAEASDPPPTADAAVPDARTPVDKAVSAHAADTAPAAEPPDTAPSASVPDSAAPADASTPVADGDFTCTLIIGINATAEWFSKGFEQLVDNAKWELIRVHSGFVTLWADPKSGAWNTGPTSACAKNATNPDRVIFVGLQFDFTTLEQWLPPLQATVKNLQAKYPGVKRIELATFVRAPGNKACPQAPAKRSTIAAAEDEAIEMVVKANPGLVIASPKFEALNCGEFSGNPPHPSASGGSAWAKRIAEHYGLGR
jgi:hypothetical protein